MDAVIFAVPHEEFKSIQLEDIKKMFKPKNKIGIDLTDEVAVTSGNDIKNHDVLVDVKGMFNRKEAEKMKFLYWRL